MGSSIEDLDFKRRNAEPPSKKKLWFISSVGISFLVMPVICLFADPILFMLEYKIRLDNGSMLHELLNTRLEGLKMQAYVFNYTNADNFLSGKDERLKVEEIGPFVYQEYRTNGDLEINREPNTMTLTPKLWLEFIPEESIGRPEDIYLTVPNIPLLASTELIRRYPYIIRQIYKAVAASIKHKTFMNIRVHEYFWGYPDPLLRLANVAVPGLIYFKSIGLLERMYDVDAVYRMELGTQGLDKFKVRQVKKLNKNNINNNYVENTMVCKDTFEGAAFPVDMSPEMPIRVYRYSICKTFPIQHVGLRRMDYGGEAFVYHVHNTTYNEYELCDSTGFCPGGLNNLASCYFGLPIAMSKGHFLDADPRLFTRVEGLAPDRKIHDAELVVDPKIGVTINGYISLQLNIFLADVSYLPETRRLKDTTLPIAHFILKEPQMLSEVKSALRLLYTDGPRMVLVAQILCLLLGLCLLAYYIRLKWTDRNSAVVNNNMNLRQKEVKAELPLLIS